MKKLLIFATVLIPFASCVTEHGGFILIPPVEVELTQIPFVIIDHQNINFGLGIPEWVNSLLFEGERGIQAIEADLDSFLFVARSEGNNFSALQLWKDTFNAELAFPRLASTRIEARFSAGVHFPDVTYGALYETLIRSVSDARWTGMAREDNFWIQRSFDAVGDEAAREDWEFLILVTIEKSYFALQLNSIFDTLNPSQPPTVAQRLTFNNVAEHFFEGF